MKPFIGFALLMLIVALATVLLPLAIRRRGSRVSWRALTVVGVAIPALAIGLYGGLSNWSWNETPVAQGVPPAIEQMVNSLETRLQSSPMDVAGWLMLGRSQFQLNRFAESVNAYQRAYMLTQGRNVEAVVGLGEALAFLDEGRNLDKVAALFDQGYALAPNHPKVLWYSGLVAYQAGRLEVARDRWAELIALEPPPQVKRLLQDKVIEIEADLLRAKGEVPQSDPASVSPVVRVRVSIAPALAQHVPPGAPLFVLVRSGEGGGPPLAATKRTASDLPALIELSNKDMMIAGRNLDGAGKVTVLARVARSGEPAARSGDLEGRVSYDVDSQAPVDLVIDSIVP